MKGFKEFLMQGNIAELAVAVVVGTAFAAVVDKFVSGIITPLLNSFGGAESSGLGFHIRSGNEKTFVDFSSIINALIVFVMTAVIVYFLIILPMNKIKERRGIVDDPAPTPEELLTEIRDELRSRP